MENIFRWNVIWKPILVILIIACILATIRTRHYQFNGIVEKISYNEMNTPLVTINGYDYDLTEPGWDFTIKRIEVGDRLIKNKSSMDLKLIKRNTSDTINLYRK